MVLVQHVLLFAFFAGKKIFHPTYDPKLYIILVELNKKSLTMCSKLRKIFFSRWLSKQLSTSKEGEMVKKRKGMKATKKKGKKKSKRKTKKRGKKKTKH